MILLLCCQASKENVLELNAQLESLKMEMGNSRGSSGNSLFGEVRTPTLFLITYVQLLLLQHYHSPLIVKIDFETCLLKISEGFCYT